MLIARCRTEDLSVAQQLEEAGARLMDTLVYFARPLDPGEPGELGAFPVRSWAGEADEVRKVAAEAFHGYSGHYHADRRLAPASCDEVYASWAYRSCVDEGSRAASSSRSTKAG
jgi:hypothetical protein